MASMLFDCSTLIMIPPRLMVAERPESEGCFCVFPTGISGKLILMGDRTITSLENVVFKLPNNWTTALDQFANAPKPTLFANGAFSNLPFITAAGAMVIGA